MLLYVYAVAAEGILKLLDLTFHIMEHNLISYNNQANLQVTSCTYVSYGLAIPQLHYGTQAYTELIHACITAVFQIAPTHE